MGKGDASGMDPVSMQEWEELGLQGPGSSWRRGRAQATQGLPRHEDFRLHPQSHTESPRILTQQMG